MKKMRNKKPIIAVFSKGTAVTIPNPQGHDRAWLFKAWCKKHGVEPFATLY